MCMGDPIILYNFCILLHSHNGLLILGVNIGMAIIGGLAGVVVIWWDMVGNAVDWVKFLSIRLCLGISLYYTNYNHQYTLIYSLVSLV